jgi:hypothetical protein
MSIYDTNDAFDFSKLVLAKPVSVSGGNFFIRFLVGGSPLYIQSPKCLTKQGFLKSGKKLYTDLVLTNENHHFIQWMENLESHSHKGIYENREKWFDGDLELHDIENYFSPILKIYKTGKFYSIRVNINTDLGKPTLKIYDEDENDIDIEKIDDKTQIITILELKGIKCSTRSFQIEVEMKQMMVLKPVNLFDNLLLIKGGGGGGGGTSPQVAPTSCETPVDNSPETPVDNLDDSTPVAEPPIDISVSEPPHPPLFSENNLQEIDFHLDELSETMQIKERDDVYYKLYKDARKKAKDARQIALTAYLEAKEIKNKYMLDDIDDDSDGEGGDNYDDDGQVF